jgi:hypothetical protein
MTADAVEGDESAREPAVTTPEDRADHSDAGPPTDTTPATDADESDDIHALVDAVAEDVLPGSGAKLADRRAALLATVEYLAEQGQSTPSDFRTEVYPEHRAHYTDGKDPARSWWKNCIYKGLSALAERTDAVEKADQTGVWSWRGDDLDDGSV